MKLYLQNLLERLSKYSETLSQKEIFIDAPWVKMDTSSSHEKFIFRRNGELIYSQSGLATRGKWEYIHDAKSLLIDNGKGGVMLLKQGFISSGVMTLIPDGSADLVILVNENVIPDLDVDRYLKDQLIIKNKLRTVDLENGLSFEFSDTHNAPYVPEGVAVTSNFEPVSDGVYYQKGKAWKYTVKSGRIASVHKLTNFKTEKGTITVEGKMISDISIGDTVYYNDLDNSTGEFYVEYLNAIVFVEEGKVVRIRDKSRYVLPFTLFVLIVISAIIVYFIGKSGPDKFQEQVQTTDASLNPEEKTGIAADSSITSRINTANPGPVIYTENDTILLSGTLRRQLFYGPPNFGEDPESDAKEYCYVLHLNKSVFFNGEGTAEGMHEVAEQIHLVGMNDFDFGKYIDRSIEIKTTLANAMTGHHHTTVIAWDILAVNPVFN